MHRIAILFNFQNMHNLCLKKRTFWAFYIFDNLLTVTCIYLLLIKKKMKMVLLIKTK